MHLKICIIDGSVNMKFLKEILPGSYGRIHILERGKHDDNSKLSYLHGTVCLAELIETLTYYDIMSSIDIFVYPIRMNSIESPDDLICALEFCCNHDINLISLSLGMINPVKLVPIIDSLERNKHKLLCVAAASNSGKITFPASFHQVIGVKDSVLASQSPSVFIKPLDGIDIMVHRKEGKVSKIIKRMLKCSIGISSSLATPQLCGLFAYIFLQNGTILGKDEILTSLVNQYRFKSDFTMINYVADDLDQPIIMYYYDSDDNKQKILEQLKTLQIFFAIESYSLGIITDITSHSCFENSIYYFDRKHYSLNETIRFYATTTINNLFLCAVPKGEKLTFDPDLTLESTSLLKTGIDLKQTATNIISYFS